MAGMNGVSLPASLEGRLGQVLPSADWLKFTGSFPLTLLNNFNAASSIALGLLVVWLMPNVHQMFLRYRPVCEDGDGGESANDAATSKGWVAKALIWKPTTAHAIALAVLFFLSFISLTKVSEFLYFQF